MLDMKDRVSGQHDDLVLAMYKSIAGDGDGGRSVNNAVGRSS